MKRIARAEVGDHIFVARRRELEQLGVEIGAGNGIFTLAARDGNILAGIDNVIRAAGTGNFDAAVGVIDRIDIVDSEGIARQIEVVSRRAFQRNGADGGIFGDRDDHVVTFDRGRQGTARRAQSVIDSEIGDDIVAVSVCEGEHLAEVGAFDRILTFTGSDGDVFAGIGDVISLG